MIAAVFDVRNTLGALLIGVLIACCLFGIITVQAFTYYTRFPQDKLHLKAMVLLVLLCEAGHAVCVCQATYFMIVSVYGDPQELSKFPRVLSASISFNGVIGPVVQMFFAERVRVVSGKLYIPLLCGTLSLIRGCLTFATMAKGLTMVNIIEGHQQVKIFIPTLLGVGAAVDVILTATLSYYIGKRKKNTLLVDATLLWIIQTGFASFVFGIAMLVAFLKMPYNFVWLGIFAVLGRTFTCALLASLNGRTKGQRADNLFELRRRTNRETMRNRFDILQSSSSDDKSPPKGLSTFSPDENGKKSEHSIE